MKAIPELKIGAYGNTWVLTISQDDKSNSVSVTIDCDMRAWGHALAQLGDMILERTKVDES